MTRHLIAMAPGTGALAAIGAASAAGPAYDGWRYGGRMLSMIPSAGAVGVLTAQADQPSGRTGDAARLRRFVAGVVVPALRPGGGA